MALLLISPFQKNVTTLKFGNNLTRMSHFTLRQQVFIATRPRKCYDTFKTTYQKSYNHTNIMTYLRPQIVEVFFSFLDSTPNHIIL